MGRSVPNAVPPTGPPPPSTPRPLSLPHLGYRSPRCGTKGLQARHLAPWRCCPAHTRLHRIALQTGHGQRGCAVARADQGCLSATRQQAVALAHHAAAKHEYKITTSAQQRTQCRRVGHDADHPHVRAQRLLHRFQRHARRNADHLKHIPGCRCRPLVHPQLITDVQLAATKPGPAAHALLQLQPATPVRHATHQMLLCHVRRQALQHIWQRLRLQQAGEGIQAIGASAGGKRPQGHASSTPIPPIPSSTPPVQERAAALLTELCNLGAIPHTLVHSSSIRAKLATSRLPPSVASPNTDPTPMRSSASRRSQSFTLQTRREDAHSGGDHMQQLDSRQMLGGN